MRMSGTVARWIAAIATVICTGCSGSLPGVDLPPVREVQAALEFPDLRDYRGVVDCRPRESGVTQVKLADLAHDAQIDFVCLADRAKAGSSDYGIGGFTSEVLIVPGASFSGGAGGAEIVGLNIHDPIDPGMAPAAIVEAIRRQNGLAIAVAPSRFKSSDDYALADAIEIYNLQRAWSAQNPAGLYMRALFFGANHFFSDLDAPPAQDVARYDQMAAGARVTMVAGLGGEEDLSVIGTKVGTFQQLMQVFTTHVLAPAREVDPVVEALKRGHAYASFDILGYVPDFAFYANSAGGKVMMGEEVPFSANLKLSVELPDSADQIAILRDGQPVASTERAASFEFQPKLRGAYRAEAVRGGRPWILSNPIYVR